MANHQQLRQTKVRDVRFYKGTDFVACSMCGEKRAGWFVGINIEVLAPRSDNTLMARVNVHLDCLLGAVPMQLVSDPFRFVFDFNTKLPVVKGQE